MEWRLMRVEKSFFVFKASIIQSTFSQMVVYKDPVMNVSRKFSMNF